MIRSRSRQLGSAIVEASLTLLLFFVLLFSLIDFAYVMFLEQTMTHQARAAARYGVVNAWMPDILDKVKSMATCGDSNPCSGGLLGELTDLQTNFDYSTLITAVCIDDTALFGTACKDLVGTNARIVVTIPGVPYIPFAPLAPKLTRPAITVSLPIENTTDLGVL